MGAMFHANVQHFESIGAYCAAFPAHRLFPFMLDGQLELRPGAVAKPPLFSLVFGNEAAGLDEQFQHMGTSVKLAQSPQIDSLNLSTAVAIGTYLFTVEGQ